MPTLWAAAAPVGLFVLTGNLGAGLVLAAGVLVALALGLGARYFAVGTAAVGAGLAFFSFVPFFNRVRPAAASSPNPVAEARNALAGTPSFAGHGIGLDGLRVHDPLRNEFALTLLGRQWGLIGIVVAVTLGAFLLYFLFDLVSGQRHNGVRAGPGIVAAGLAAMLAAGLILPVAAFGLDRPELRVVMPLLAADATSFVLTLAVLGFIVGDPDRRPYGPPPGGPQ
jgi:hypothetical protein